jgi:hypothetical protein
MNRVMLGRLIGIFLLVLLILGVPYAVTAFTLWEGDPSQWEPGNRLLSMALAGVIAVIYILLRDGVSYSTPDEE